MACNYCMLLSNTKTCCSSSVCEEQTLHSNLRVLCIPVAMCVYHALVAFLENHIYLSMILGEKLRWFKNLHDHNNCILLDNVRLIHDTSLCSLVQNFVHPDLAHFKTLLAMPVDSHDYRSKTSFQIWPIMKIFKLDPILKAENTPCKWLYFSQIVWRGMGRIEVLVGNDQFTQNAGNFLELLQKSLEVFSNLCKLYNISSAYITAGFFRQWRWRVIY